MKKPAKIMLGTIAFLSVITIILDSKTAISSIADGVTLCLQTVIPSLFPFLFLTGIINSCFWGQYFVFMEPLQRLCRIPVGSESILLIGLVSGYPVGAKLVSDAYTSGRLSKENAIRMLGFCSNAGPSFIFGMLSAVFSRPAISWVLWLIHIISAIYVGWLLPGGTPEKSILKEQVTLSINKTLQNAIMNIATVCGWVILFRCILSFMQKWILHLLPPELQILISGLIELTNGCVSLQDIPHEGLRFILAATMLAFGGICVALQTVSVAGDLGWGYYFPGKVMQALISATISCILHPFLFSGRPLPLHYYILTMTSVVIISLLIRKKVVAFGGRLLYNTDN